MQDTLTRDRFQALLDKSVELWVDNLALPAQIIEVSAHTQHDDSEREPFSVVFVTGTQDNHGQQIYTLKHPEIGVVELFLVPLGPKGTGMSYEAVIT